MPGKTPSQRQLRAGELVRHALAELLARGEIEDPLLAGQPPTVTEVSMSPDLKNATAFVTPFAADDPAALSEALNRHAKYIRGRLGPALRQMRNMPTLRFRADDRFDNYSRIDTLLRSPRVSRDLEPRQDDE